MVVPLPLMHWHSQTIKQSYRPRKAIQNTQRYTPAVPGLPIAKGSSVTQLERSNSQQVNAYSLSPMLKLNAMVSFKSFNLKCTFSTLNYSVTTYY